MDSHADAGMSSADGPDVPRPEEDGGATEGSGGDSSGEISNDVLFDVLSNRRRRYALHYLKQQEDARAEMGDLSTQVAAWEFDTEPEALAYDERKSVHASLYQYHAPKLDEAGVVDYDSRRGVVELTDAGADLDLYLEAVSGRDVPWATYYLLLSGVAVSLMSAVHLEVYPLTLVPDVTWGLFVAVAFLVSSAVFAYENRASMRLGNDGPPPGVDAENGDGG